MIIKMIIMIIRTSIIERKGLDFLVTTAEDENEIGKEYNDNL